MQYDPTNLMQPKQPTTFRDLQGLEQYCTGIKYIDDDRDDRLISKHWQSESSVTHLPKSKEADQWAFYRVIVRNIGSLQLSTCTYTNTTTASQLIIIFFSVHTYGGME